MRDVKREIEGQQQQRQEREKEVEKVDGMEARMEKRDPILHLNMKFFQHLEHEAERGLWLFLPIVYGGPCFDISGVAYDVSCVESPVFSFCMAAFGFGHET